MNGLVRNVFPVIICLSLGLGTQTVVAESKCKGLSKSACSSDKTCSWIKGYKKQDGKEVKGYCRVKSSKKKASMKMNETKKKTMKFLRNLLAALLGFLIGVFLLFFILFIILEKPAERFATLASDFEL